MFAGPAKHWECAKWPCLNCVWRHTLNTLCFHAKLRFNVVHHDRDAGAGTEDAARAQRCKQLARLIEAFDVPATPDELADQLESVRFLASRPALRSANIL